MLKEAAEEASKKRAEAASGKYGGFTDPTASLGGFRRDRGKIWEVEKQQEEFLRQQNRGSEKSTEMSEDLLKFLNEAGPLERRVDKELTSPKLYEELTNEENERRLREEEVSLRKHRRMPLAERLEDLSDAAARNEEEKMALSVNRTTNFSTGEEAEDPTVVRLKDVDLIELLRTDISRGQSTMPYGAEDLPSTEEAAEAYLRDIESTFPEGVVPASGLREDNLSLIKNALKYSAVPILMKEMESADYVGVWKHKVEDLKKLQLRLVGDDELMLVLDKVKRNEGVDAMDQSVLTGTSETSKTKEVERTRASAGKKGKLQGEGMDKTGTDALSPSDSTDDSYVREKDKHGTLKKGRRARGTAAFLEEERKRLKEQAAGANR
eukprot:CAMPEP_0113541874 /NCGR_PEP_ID=MMETSP0015_2-20120614/9287_1 /TAXON_ID=2838 /ORGANISM="Odontella" /LENGTH=379 /DNA_ID=CAMNT_0000441855 /DNA_START=186 /DNA_END=1325 /DNA_ORIENTATION=- /assembly_acc=CAM_ASM_000160